MARVKVNQFPLVTTIADTDLGVVANPTTGIASKITWANILTFFRTSTKTTIPLTALQMASFSGTVDGAAIVVLDGKITITWSAALLAKHGKCVEITATVGNQTGISKQGTFDDITTPTTLTVDIGALEATILTLK